MRRLYVLIEKTLDPIYGCVQGGHAVAQYLIEHSNNCWNNEYLIYVKANINEWKDRLDWAGKDYSIFHEPDLDNKPTAIAVEDNGRLFRKLELVK